MFVSPPTCLPVSRACVAAVLALGLSLAGCASMSDGMSTAFADPAKYELYDCKQLEPERKRLIPIPTEQVKKGPPPPGSLDNQSWLVDPIKE